MRAIAAGTSAHRNVKSERLPRRLRSKVDSDVGTRVAESAFTKCMRVRALRYDQGFASRL